MKKQTMKIALFFGIATLVVFACSKVDDSLPGLTEEQIVLSQDDIAADNVFLGIDGSVQDKLNELENEGYQVYTVKSADEEFTCLTVSIDYPDSTTFPKVITFDYGTGCEVVYNGDTVAVEGKIIVTLTGRMCVAGSQRIMTFEDFYVNEMKVEGTITNMYMGLLETGYHSYKYTLEGGKLSFADEEGNELFYTRDGELNKQWLRSWDFSTDTIRLTGLMWGENAEGVSYSREITKELIMVHCLDYGRRWVTIDGQIVSAFGDESITTDYSLGGCDGTATIIRDGKQYRFRIRDHHRKRLHTGLDNETEGE
jgi:hypothetical protein